MRDNTYVFYLICCELLIKRTLNLNRDSYLVCDPIFYLICKANINILYSHILILILFQLLKLKLNRN